MATSKKLSMLQHGALKMSDAELLIFLTSGRTGWQMKFAAQNIKKSLVLGEENSLAQDITIKTHPVSTWHSYLVLFL